jgi:glycosyltransferase involved in cell wall biosynthesis
MAGRFRCAGETGYAAHGFGDWLRTAGTLLRRRAKARFCLWGLIAPPPAGSRDLVPVLKRRVFYLLNQNPLDGDVHSLYCARHVLSLAQAAPPGWEVALLHASFAPASGILRLHSSKPSPALRMVGLPSIKKAGLCPIQYNAVFHHSALLYLKANARPGDIASAASFPELFLFLARRLGKSRPRLVYEVHQLEELTLPADHPKCLRESEALEHADALLTTCAPLEAILRRRFPQKPISNLGLASTYPAAARRPFGGGALRFGYFGSVSKEQGVPWIVKNWGRVRQLAGAPHELHIHGLARRGLAPPPSDHAAGVFVHAPVPSNAVPQACSGLDALAIPPLDLAHRASIAFTKAYDFAGLGLPIVCSDLPTIREVLEPGEHALFFEPGSVDGLAAAIKKLAMEPGLAGRLSANLFLRARFFSWQRRAERWWAAFAP